MTGSSRISLLTACPSCKAHALTVIEAKGAFAGGECPTCGTRAGSTPVRAETLPEIAVPAARCRAAAQLPIVPTPPPEAARDGEPNARRRTGLGRRVVTGAAYSSFVVAAVALLATVLYRGLPTLESEPPTALSAPVFADAPAEVPHPAIAPNTSGATALPVPPAASAIGDAGIASLIDLKRRLPGTFPDPREGMMASEMAAYRAAESATTAERALGLSAQRRREVQRRLLLAGHDPNGVDGVFGPATRAAVANWQREAGIPSTGYLGRETLALLEQQTQQAFLRTQSRAGNPAARRAAPEDPAQPAERAAGSDRCQRNDGGAIAYGSTFKCDVAGLRESLGTLRRNLNTLLRGGEPAASPGRS